VAQTLNLRIDEYGQTLESVSIGYPRFMTFSDPDLTDTQNDLVRAVQAERHLSLSTTRYTRDEISLDARRLRVPWETTTYELTGLAPQSGRFYTLTELRAADLAGGGTVEVAYHVQPDRRATAVQQRRLVETQRTTYFADDLVAERPLGECGARALPRERYRLALTRDLLAGALADAGRLNDALDALNASDAQGHPVSGYRRADQLWKTSQNALRNVTTTAPLAEQYWQASGVAGFSPGAADRFFQPDRYVDPFGAQTLLVWDPSTLFVRQNIDAFDNALTIETFDFRTLAPSVMRDANDNVISVAFDALGRVVVVAAQGKPVGPDQWEGDSLAGVTPALLNPPRAQVATFCLALQFDEAAARTWLGQATARYVYHFGESVAADGSVGWGQQMAGACGITRERHVSTLASGKLSPLQVKLECSDGMGAVLMQKLQAEPDPLGSATTPRWIVNGLTVENNKGNPVMQFEPAFTNRFGFERPAANGVSTLTFYDAAGRVLRTEMPDGTFTRVEFTPWEVRSFDLSDTVRDSRWYAERTVATASVHDQRAARLSERLAESPARVLMDALGRSVVSVVHQREPDWDSAITASSVADAPWRDRHHLTFTKLDAEGKPLWMVDARGNRVMQYIAPALPARTRLAADAAAGDPDPYAVPLNAVPCYDLAGNLLHQVSMDSGERWMVSDAAGQPMLVWDRNEAWSATRAVSVMQSRRFRTVYDRLRRPVGRMASFDDAPEVWVERFEYLDTAALAGTPALSAARRANLIGQTAAHRDASGVTRTERVNFTGNIEEVSRQLVSRATSAVVDWNPADTPPVLDAETYRQITEYDALGRMTMLYQWHRDTAPGVSNRVAVYVPQYNARGLLRAETLHVRARKVRDPLTQARGFVADPTRSREVVTDLQYNEKGQKTLLQRGNGTVTRYAYDPWTYRVTELSTRFVNPALGRTRRIQALSFTYDAAGQVVRIHDDAQPGVWQAGLYSNSTQFFVYDALSRLIEATGREHATMAAPRGLEFGPVPQSPFPTSDLLRPYRQRYVYDDVGNFRRLEHFAPPAPGRQDGSYSRYHQTASESNRLEATWYGDPRRTQGNGEVAYRFDSHGNHLNLLSSAPDADLRWDWQDMIASLDLNGGGRARYQYGSDRQRSRKIVERLGGAIEERVYLGGFERYRRWGSTGVLIEEIETLHVFEGEERMLLVEDVLEARRSGVGTLRFDEPTGWRFQYGNHLGSVATELDQMGREVSYEEFHPYGTTAYVKQESALAAPAKRYRFTGMERDEESGLQYHSARYFVPWLGRWSSSDPAPRHPSDHRYSYCRGNPISYLDINGLYEISPGFLPGGAAAGGAGASGAGAGGAGAGGAAGIGGGAATGGGIVVASAAIVALLAIAFATYTTYRAVTGYRELERARDRSKELEDSVKRAKENLDRQIDEARDNGFLTDEEYDDYKASGNLPRGFFTDLKDRRIGFYATPSEHRGRPEWLQRIIEGIYFNRLQYFSYQYRELYVEYAGSKSGYAILDFYIPGLEIGSRKNTQFSEITIETGIQYLRELVTKYPKGARIADVPTSGEQTGGLPSAKSLAGAKLEGRHVLEVPRQISPIPPEVLDEANRLGITIRDVYGHEYNKPPAPPPEATAVPGVKDSNAPPPPVPAAPPGKKK
jgi:RHS repeat-associated protein